MRRSRNRLDPTQRLLIEQALKLTPAERFTYALGLAKAALQVNPRLLKQRMRWLDRLAVAKHRLSQRR